MDGEANHSPFLFSTHMNKWLENALDCGISEERFWSMTLAEITRHIESYNRRQEIQQKERATFDYILADLIGRSVARTQHSANKLPRIDEAYPSLFKTEDVEAQKQERQIELSALRFRRFALAHNEKFE